MKKKIGVALALIAIFGILKIGGGYRIAVSRDKRNALRPPFERS